MNRNSIALLSGLVLLLAAVGVQAGPGNVRPVKAENEITASTSPARPADGFRTHAPVVFADLQFTKPTFSGTVETAALGNRISAAAMAGGVRGFATSPDGAKAVYLADQETLGLIELYSVPVDGSAAPVKLNSGLTFGAGDQGVSLFLISPDGNRVIFLADPAQGGGVDELYSAPIDGSVAAVRLNGSGDVPVTAFGITPDSSRVAYFGTTSSGVVELYRASIDTAGTATRLSDIAGFNPDGNVVAAEISPDSARVVFSADRSDDDVYQWFSVAVSATGPGTEIRLSNALNFVSLGAISPDSSTVVYTGDESNNLVMDLYAVPIVGGTPTRLNPVHSGNGVSAIAISPDGSRVAYLADQDTLDLNQLYSAQTAVASSGVRLNTPLSGSQSVDTLTISPDGTTVLYEADENLAGTFDLLAVPIDGSAAPVTLHGMTPPDNAGSFGSLGTPVFGRRAVYPVFGATVDFYNVPVAGGEPFTRINDPMNAGDDLFNGYLPAAGGRLLAYGVGPTADGITSRVYAATIRADLAAEQVNATAPGGSLGVLAYEIADDEGYAVYLQDQATVGKPELFSAALDTDADGVINAADDCRFVANPLQNGAVFASEVLARSSTEFTWGVDAEVRWIRGPLASVDVLATDASGSLVDASSLTDASQPAAGAGFYYLFAPDCPGRSYQSSLGVEPQRDLAALP